MDNCISEQMSFQSNVIWAIVFLGKCLSGQISFWAIVFMGKCPSGQMSSGQMSFRANVFWQMSARQMSLWANVFLGKCRLGKRPSEQMSLGKRPMGKCHGASQG
jgi:hypothetical protein